MRSLLLLVPTALSLSVGQVSAQTGAFVGIVWDSVGAAPLSGVSISVPNQELITTSGADGRFRLPGIASGQHRLVARLEGYSPWAADLTVRVTDSRDLPLGRILMKPAYEAWFIGTIRDSATQEPLSRSEITIVDRGLTTQSTTDGTFELAGVTTGQVTVFIRHLGYKVWSKSFHLSVDEPFRVDFGTVDLIPVGAVELEDIVVEGEEFRASRVMQGFLSRMRSEEGTFITYEDIEKTNPSRTSDLLRSVGGFSVSPDGVIESRRGAAGISSFAPCVASYFIDGVQAGPATLDIIMPQAIAGIEIYRGSASTPTMFRSLRNAKCGVVAVWTKDGGRRRR